MKDKRGGTLYKETVVTQAIAFLITKQRRKLNDTTYSCRQKWAQDN